MNQLTIACCQRLQCDCESLIRLYETRFIVWPPFVQRCQIWSLQSNPPLISGCSVISHRQYVLKSNEEATSSQSYKIRGIVADSEAHQRQREIDYFYPFVLLPNSLLHKCVCVPSIKQERKKKVIEPARRNAAGTGKKKDYVLIWRAAYISSHFGVKYELSAHSTHCAAAQLPLWYRHCHWWQPTLWMLGKQTCVMCLV